MSQWGFGVGSKATQTMMENGSVTSATNAAVSEPNFWAKGAELLIAGVKVTAKFLIDNNEIFIIICLVGMIIVISGREELGKKISSGGFLGFIIAKVVEELC